MSPMLRMAIRRGAAIGPLLLLCLAVGCGGPQPKPLSPEEVHLQKFGRLYFEHRMSTGKPPANVQELKAWAKKQGKDKLDKMEIDDVEQAFVSPRDHEPYVLVQLPMGMGPVLAHEKSGAGGRRLVLNSQGNVMDVNETQFQDLLKSNPGRPPAKR